MGFGRYIVANGDYYEGDVKIGQAHGCGTYVSSTLKFEGHFKNDSREGWGVEFTP
jgi:hypothetical protein